ncbi:MAG: tannase/feruloyl esterase family alpha/beta hydrolase [Caulobacteraceae bacterium]
MRVHTLALIGAAGLLACGSTLAIGQTTSPGAACESLAHAAFPDTTTIVTSAAVVTSVEARGPFGPPTRIATPEHCAVDAKMQERKGANGQTYAVRFRVRLPDTWNGRLFFEGGGGSDGVVGSTLGSLMGGQTGNALERGYAVVSQDSGHDNATNNDPKLQGVVTFGWDAEARRNYGGASIGSVVRAAKALVQARYGRAPQFTYFAGGSKGGQEAMMAAQRFPDEFDAVLVGYPGFHLAYAGGVEQMWDAQAFAEAARVQGFTTADGLPLAGKALSDPDLALVAQAVLKTCDALDGLEDGMVEAVGACTSQRVAPALDALACRGAKAADCLLPAQIAAMRKAFDGARSKDGRALYSDWLWDPGLAAPGWRIWKMGPDAAPTNQALSVSLGGASASAVFTSPPTPVADDPATLTRYTLGVDIDQNYAKTKVKWGAFNESAVDFMHADATDLSRFTGRGGKILIYHGAADPVFSLNDTINWVKQVDAKAGGRADAFLRLYPVPGMNHGGGGPATDQFAAFDALVAWREQGSAPGPLVATARQGAPWPGRTRLLCPWPQQPRYAGGDKEKAESFRCMKP